MFTINLQHYAQSRHFWLMVTIVVTHARACLLTSYIASMCAKVSKGLKILNGS